MTEEIQQDHHFSGSVATTLSERTSNRMENDFNGSGTGLTLIQRVAICFAAGVGGGLAVVLFGRVLFVSGFSTAVGVDFPVSLQAPGVYRPLFWPGCGASRLGS